MCEYEDADGGTVADVMHRFAAYLDQIAPEHLDSVANEANRMLNFLMAEDFFGTEGQCDPRGDHRD